MTELPTIGKELWERIRRENKDLAGKIERVTQSKIVEYRDLMKTQERFIDVANKDLASAKDDMIEAFAVVLALDTIFSEETGGELMPDLPELMMKVSERLQVFDTWVRWLATQTEKEDGDEDGN